MPQVVAYVATWSLAHVVEAAVVRTILINVVLGAHQIEHNGETYVAVGHCPAA